MGFRRRPEHAFTSALAVFAFFAILAFTQPAFADDGGLVWGPDVVESGGSNRLGAVAIANSSFNAACFTVGVDPDAASVYRTTINASNTAFGTFSRKFNHLTSSASSDPSWAGLASDMFDGWGAMYGRSRVYYAKFTQDELDAAKAFAQSTISHGYGSGGGGGAFTESKKTGGGGDSSVGVVDSEIGTNGIDKVYMRFVGKLSYSGSGTGVTYAGSGTDTDYKYINGYYVSSNSFGSGLVGYGSTHYIYAYQMASIYAHKDRAFCTMCGSLGCPPGELRL